MGKRLGSPVPHFKEYNYPSSNIYDDRIEFMIDSTPYAVEYNIYRDNWSVPYDTVTAQPLTTYIDTNVEPGKIYYYRLSSISSACGESPLSLPAEPGWINGVGCFDVLNCQILVCDENVPFQFDSARKSCRTISGCITKSIPNRGIQPGYRPGPHRLFLECRPGSHTGYFECYKGFVLVKRNCSRLSFAISMSMGRRRSSASNAPQAKWGLRVIPGTGSCSTRTRHRTVTMY